MKNYKLAHDTIDSEDYINMINFLKKKKISYSIKSN